MSMFTDPVLRDDVVAVAHGTPRLQPPGPERDAVARVRRQVVALDRFGASGAAEALYQHFQLTAEVVADRVRTLVGGH